jgi:uncharacterized membrane protein HdeD (DUF308 family)
MPTLGARSSWLTIEGIGLIVLGALAILFPLFAGIAVAVFIGWLLIIVGVLGLLSAFAGREHVDLVWSVASAVIAILAGLLLLLHPLFAAVGITILVAAYLIFDGVTLIALGLDQKKRGVLRWRWVLASGVVDILLALLILTLSGVGSAALIGVIVGISLAAAGIGLLAAHRSGVQAAGL